MAARQSSSSTIALWIVATIAAVFFLRSAMQLLIPIVLAVLVSYALEPVVAWLAARRVPRPAGTMLVVLGLFGAMGWGIWTLGDQALQTIESLPETARRIRQMAAAHTGSGPVADMREAATELDAAAREPSRSTGADSGPAQPGASGGADGAGAGTGGPQAGASSRADDSPESAGDARPAPAAGTESAVPGLFRWGVSSIVALLGHLTVIVFLVVFLLLSGHHVRDRLVEIAGPDQERRRMTARILDDINAQIQRFLLVRLFTSAVVAVLTAAVLSWLGIGNPALWGAMAGVFNSIPYFGPIVVSGGLLLVGLAEGGSLTVALQASGAALVITSVEGWLLTPPLMGKAERMSVLAVFLGLLLWTWIWGAWGTILAVPMLVAIKSVADHVPALRPVGRLMAP